LRNEEYGLCRGVVAEAIHRDEDARSVETVVNGGKNLPTYTQITVIGCSYGWIVAVYRLDDSH
jgi:hypothetical protein